MINAIINQIKNETMRHEKMAITCKDKHIAKEHKKSAEKLAIAGLMLAAVKREVLEDACTGGKQ